MSPFNMFNTFNTRWRDGKKLESYVITEEIKGKPLPQFKVRLKLVGKPEETNIYLVVGIDPLQVWCDVDYKNSFGETIKGM